jgi:signal peptidase
VNKDTKHTAIIIVAALVIILVVFAGISKASGVSPFQTVVESGSMQHGPESRVGIIDTGDVVILKNKDKVNIQTFVDGYKSGYSKFGNYGDVIIYDRGPNFNPIIHRAILYMEYNDDGTWRAPSLENYPYDIMWSCTSGNNYNALSGTLTMKNLGAGRNVVSAVNLTELAKWSNSGYLTMGDANARMDQPSGIPGVYGLVSYDQIKSVAWFEVPWVGAIKMINSGSGDVLRAYAPNTIGCLTAAILFIIFILTGISFLFDYRYYNKFRKELYEEMDAPAPLFPLEPKNK